MAMMRRALQSIAYPSWPRRRGIGRLGGTTGPARRFQQPLARRLGIIPSGLVAATLLVPARVAATSTSSEEAAFDPFAVALDGPLPTAAPGYWWQLRTSMTAASRGGMPRTRLGYDSASEDWDLGSLLAPRDAVAYPAATLELAAELALGESGYIRGTLFSGQIAPGTSLDPPVEGVVAQAQSVGDYFAGGDFIRELLLGIQAAGFEAAIGRQIHQVASGLVFEDVATGAFLSYDFQAQHGVPARLFAAATALGRDWEALSQLSPLVDARLELDVGFLQTVSVWGAYLLDQGGRLHDVAVSAVAESVLRDIPDTPFGQLLQKRTLDALFLRERRSQGQLGYFGGDLELLPCTGCSIRAQAAGQLGELQIDTESGLTRYRMRGWAATTEGHYSFGDWWDVGFVGFALSGAEAPERNANAPTDYRAFIAPAPFWDWSSLFFSGHLSTGLYPARATAAGVNGHGVYGGGPVAGWWPNGGHVELRVVTLAAMAPMTEQAGGGGGRLYGLELDVRAGLELTAWLRLGAEANMLLPGSFFTHRRPAWRVLTWLEGHYEG